jgi:hypothetical protein
VVTKSLDKEVYFITELEGQEGLEPSTFCLRGRRSNQLSYWPKEYNGKILPKYLCFCKPLVAMLAKAVALQVLCS